MTYKIYTDTDVAEKLSAADAVDSVEAALREKYSGTLIAPSRYSIDLQKGSLVFTTGAAVGNEKVVGFRVYDTFPHDSTNTEQIVAVFDSESGTLKGVVIGGLLGAMRTGALGGVAVKYMAKSDASSVTVIGSGFQAETQLLATCAVRAIKQVKVYSRTESNRKNFCAKMSALLNLSVEPAASLEEAVVGADIILLCTNSEKPVLDASLVKEGVHINTVGQKWKDAHELDISVIEKADIIAADSLEQIKGYSKPFFISESGISHIISLSDILGNAKAGRKTDKDISVFCSVGLAGTEVVVANKLFQSERAK